MNNPKNMLIVNNNNGETVKFEDNLPEEKDKLITILMDEINTLANMVKNYLDDGYVFSIRIESKSFFSTNNDIPIINIAIKGGNESMHINLLFDPKKYSKLILLK